MTKPATKTCHYTNLGMSMQPREADEEGCLPYRDGYQESIPESEWTDAERVIDAAERRIEKFQRS